MIEKLTFFISRLSFANNPLYSVHVPYILIFVNFYNDFYKILKLEFIDN